MTKSNFSRILLVELTLGEDRHKLGGRTDGRPRPFLLASMQSAFGNLSTTTFDAPATVTTTLDGRELAVLRAATPQSRGYGPVNVEAHFQQGLPMELAGLPGLVWWKREPRKELASDRPKRSRLSGSLRYYGIEVDKYKWTFWYDARKQHENWVVLSRGPVPNDDIIVRVDKPPLSEASVKLTGRPEDTSLWEVRDDCSESELALMNALYLGTSTFTISFRPERTARFWVRTARWLAET